ncbi:helix-hairpin-helix domain-containing protein [Paratissierella segnis]|uniref:Helix-hairpin-helix domain-containing protein n=1 Tax=Paratissierella segnis TaxID=2763679 RepID=A0A926ILM9_9FIRM|nr:helix-hairpin-helix domain-containing protein [Paratissierella segnis]MBC8588823.1 helix-hairpin-helix domain-containing protein [Paratissierella segnis]
MDSFTKKEQIAILVVVLFIISLLGFHFIDGNLLKQNKNIGLINDIIDEGDIEDPGEIEEETEKEEDNQIIMVHISGEVYNPGLIKLFSGDRVVDAVELAGGLKKEADLDRINLAKKLEDEEKIYIPKIGEEINKSELIASTEMPSSNDNTSNKININTCSISELESLPGIGQVIAGRIVEYRKSDSFKTIDDLKNVSGIGDKKFEGLKDFITVK